MKRMHKSVGKKVTKRGGKRTTPIWKNLAIELILVVIGLSVIVYGFTYRVPDAIPKPVGETLNVNYQVRSVTVADSSGQNHTILTPPVTLDLETIFKAQGTYGADNPITISAKITKANITVTDYYCCLLFVNALPVDYPFAKLFDWLPLMNQGDGTYTAEGVLVWPDGGPTYTWLLPNFPPHTKATYNIPLEMITSGGRPPTLTIGPISETLTWQNDQRNTQLELITLGVIIIGPYEVAKRLL